MQEATRNTKKDVLNRFWLPKGVQKISESLIGDDQAAAEARRLFGIDAVWVEEREDSLMVLNLRAGASTKEFKFMLPNPGVVAGMPFKMKDIVKSASPEDPEAGGDFSDPLPFGFIFWKVVVGAPHQVQVHSESEVMPGGEAIGTIVGIVGTMPGEKDDLDALQLQKEIEKADSIGEFGVESLKKISSSDLIEGGKRLDGKGGRSGGISGGRRCGRTAHGKGAGEQEERKEASQEGFW